MAKKKNKKIPRGKVSHKKLISTLAFVCVLIIIAIIYTQLSPEFKDKLLGAGSNSSNNSIHISSNLEGDLRIHFVDVGQGDGIVIELPDNTKILIDAAKKTKCDQLVEYINALGITTFDYVIATHADEDHIGGMTTIFNNYEIKNIYQPSGRKDTQTYSNFLESIANEQGCKSVYFNRETDLYFEFDDGSKKHELVIDFLTPTASIEEIYYSDANDYSPIMLIEYAGRKVMLTGDAETAAENEFLEEYGDIEIDVDILKVAHHGSSTSTSTRFLDKIKPEYAIISCGVGNSYRHPTQTALTNLISSQAEIFRTDVQGDIVFTIDKEGEISSLVEKEFNYDDLFAPGT